MNVADKRSFLASDRPPPYIAGMFIETETTPNPASLKFLPGQPVMQQGTREFATPEAAEASPLAQAIFDTGEVVKRVKRLLGGHPDLLDGFNCFLPEVREAPKQRPSPADAVTSHARAVFRHGSLRCVSPACPRVRAALRVSPSER